MNRLMRVVVNGQYSLPCQKFLLECHMQGSVLPYILFLLFVNDLPDWVKTNIRMFADDTKIWTKISYINDAAALQKDLDSLSTWSTEWQLKFNPDK